MRTIQFSFIFSFVVCSLLLFSKYGYADAPLTSKIDGLTIEQSKQIKDIQKEARDAMRKPRGDLHREQRALRRAKTDNDSAAIAEQEKKIQPLQAEMKRIHDEEEKKIRKVLTPEQTKQYEQWLKERNAMAGSSRDVKDYTK